MKRWENFSREQLLTFVSESSSYAELAEKCGYQKSGGSGIHAVHQMVEECNFDVSHFKGQGWNLDNFDYTRFRAGNAIKTACALNAIVALRGRICERCGATEWLGAAIPLELHHKDGDTLNNSLDNLQILCPNCHALTDNWKGRNRQHRNTCIPEENFVAALRSACNIRQALRRLNLTQKGGNYAMANELIAKYNIVHLLKPTE